jgi:two-component system, sensor histidine kinase and response regulator
MSQTREAAGSVLVVDDTIENLRLLSDLLGEHGYDVRAVTSGRQALQSVAHDPPDVVLLDITMPDMDGYEVCRSLRTLESSKDVPVIFLTALTDTADKVRAFDAGAVDYVTKPFQFAEVVARVRTHVTLRRAQAALAASYDRLRELERLRDDLVHMVVHDMRAPLSVLKVNLGLLKGPVAALEDDSRADLDGAIDSARALVQMANDLLDVSRLEAGRMPIESAPCDLARMVRDVRGALRTIDLERPIDVDADGAVTVSCDGSLVRRVVENLVGNALQHTPAGSRVSIQVASRPGRARVAVHDEGPGVPAEARERIFEKFGTVAARSERSYHSAGLGLAFCKLAIEAHGGTIAVEPRVPAGSTFWFELPA